MSTERLKYIEIQLQQIHNWPEWSVGDRLMIKDMADQAAHMAGRHAKRMNEIKKSGWTP